MKKQLSFSHLERELIREFRNNINNSEGPIDVSNHFSFTACKLLSSVFPDEDIKVNSDSVIFVPGQGNHFQVDSVLMDHHKFSEVWQNSDLPDLLSKFAEASYHRYLHHNKHLEKTNKKIRNGS